MKSVAPPGLGRTEPPSPRAGYSTSDENLPSAKHLKKNIRTKLLTIAKTIN